MPYKIKKQKCKQSDGKSGTYIVLKKAKSGKDKKKSCHSGKANAKKSIAASHIGESSNEIRAFIRSVLVEERKKIENSKDNAGSLPNFFYKPLEDAIKRSSFWSYENTPDDADMINIQGEWHNQTPAAEILGATIKDTLASFGIPISVAVRSAEPEFNKKLALPVAKGHKLYPNRLVVGGSQGVTPKGRFIMYLNMVPVSSDFNSKDVDPDSIVRFVGNIVRHEYIHARQKEKRRKNQKISRLSAKDRYQDEGEVPDSSDREAYLSSKIEIDAYAHEFAETLLQRYGKEESLEILRSSKSGDDLDLPDQFREYLKNIPGDQALQSLKSKMYSHIINLTDRDIYEGNSGSEPNEAYKKATIKNLDLDKETSHGPWPSKKYDPKVNKEISNWLKSLKMLD